MSEKKQSEKLNEYTCKDYYVTAARWSVPSFGDDIDTYEIGIRSKAMNGDFTLLQSTKFNHQSVQEMAEIVCLALDHGYSPKWCSEMFS